MSSPYAATASELMALAAKYRTLLRWREEHASGGVIAERAALRAMARAFPGALRELDTVPLEVIESRAAGLVLAAQGETGEPWMDWMVAYHQVMRIALWLKPRLAALETPLDAARAAELLAACPLLDVAQGRVPLDTSFVELVARPPSGRLNSVVFSHLGALFGVDPDALRHGLFPARRRAPSPVSRDRSSHVFARPALTPENPTPTSVNSAPTPTSANPTPTSVNSTPTPTSVIPTPPSVNPIATPAIPNPPLPMIRFYGSPASSAGRTHWLLEELAVPYEYVITSPRHGGTRAPEFLAKNPSGQVPFLEDGAVRLFESMAINFYLAEKYGPALWPADAGHRALVYQWSFWAISNLQPLLLAVMMHSVLLPAEQRLASVLEDARAKVPRYLALLSCALEKSAYLVGDRFSVADVNVGSVANLALANEMSLEPYPHAKAWLERLRDRPAYQKTASHG